MKINSGQWHSPLQNIHRQKIVIIILHYSLFVLQIPGTQNFIYRIAFEVYVGWCMAVRTVQRFTTHKSYQASFKINSQLIEIRCFSHFSSIFHSPKIEAHIIAVRWTWKNFYYYYYYKLTKQVLFSHFQCSTLSGVGHSAPIGSATMQQCERLVVKYIHSRDSLRSFRHLHSYDWNKVAPTTAWYWNYYHAKWERRVSTRKSSDSTGAQLDDNV